MIADADKSKINKAFRPPLFFNYVICSRVQNLQYETTITFWFSFLFIATLCSKIQRTVER